MNTETKPTEQNGAHDPKVILKKYGLVIAIILLAFIAFAFMANNSLPGGAFYGVKVNFIEKFAEGTKAGNEAKAAYQVHLMEKRLEEVKRLSVDNTLSAKAREDLTAVIKRHTEALSSAATLESDEVPTTNLLNTVRQFVDVSAAIEQQSEKTDHLQEFAEAAEDVRRDASNLYKNLIDRYSERETQENIFNFIRDQLSKISSELNDSSLSEDTVDDAEVYINRVSPAMAEGNYPRAIGAIAEAMRFIQIEKYGVKVEEQSASSTDNGTDTATTSTSTEDVLDETAPVSTPSTSTTPSSFSFPN
jgi:hypothetical protein